MAFLAKQVIAAGAKLQLARQIQTSAPALSGLKKWVFDVSGYKKYGLLADDLLNDMDQDVVEATRRLPDRVIDDRNYRMLRATQLSIQKSILPKEEWTKYEDDVPYLQPYLEEVIRERKEREEWDATH